MKLPAETHEAQRDLKDRGDMMGLLCQTVRWIENRPPVMFFSRPGDEPSKEEEYFCRMCHLGQFHDQRALHLRGCIVPEIRRVLKEVSDHEYLEIGGCPDCLPLRRSRKHNYWCRLHRFEQVLCEMGHLGFRYQFRWLESGKGAVRQRPPKRFIGEGR